MTTKHVTTKHVMLSYQWGRQALVRKVYSSLARLGYNVWMDVEGGVNGDINDCMAYGVENSAAIICFMNESYESSVNCKRELSYADRIGVTIIPVLLGETRQNGETYLPTGWLGILTAGLHYVTLPDTPSDPAYKDAIQALAHKLEQVSTEKRCRIYARQVSLSNLCLISASTCPQLSPPRTEPLLPVQYETLPQICNGPIIEEEAAVPDPTYVSFPKSENSLLHLVVDPLEANFERDSGDSLETTYEMVSRTVKETARKISPSINWRKNYVA